MIPFRTASRSRAVKRFPSSLGRNPVSCSRTYHQTSISSSSSSPTLLLTNKARTFSSTRPYATALASSSNSLDSTSPPPIPLDNESTVLVKAPTAEELEAEGFEALDERDVQFRISRQAAEQLRTLSARAKDPNIALRVSVESGGCHGYQYKMEVTRLDESNGDYLFTSSQTRPSNVLIDPVSLSLLKGSTLDYATELIGSSFRMKDNPQASGGCGCGVSWEGKI